MVLILVSRNRVMTPPTTTTAPLLPHCMRVNSLCKRLCIHLNLQLAHSDRQVENQLSDVLQLALQQLDGLGLPLILRVNNKGLRWRFH